MGSRSGVAAVCLGALICLALPAGAMAHGPSAPVASSDVARLSRVPAGLEARVVSGNVGLWLRVPRSMTVVVIDYRGAPYLRFSRSGVQVNENCSMYYLNEKPIPAPPPLGLTSRTPPRWRRVSGAHAYNWRDERLRALSGTVSPPGTAYVGPWRIPIRIDGRRAAISGGVWHRARPSLAWFWPIIVIFACALAAWRVRRPLLDARLARLLAVAALPAAGVAGVARELYGRPAVAPFHVVELAAILGFAAWGLHRVLAGRPGYLLFFLISLIALWEGVELLPTLTHGYALTAVPASAARAASALCLGCGASMLLFVFRLVLSSGEAPLHPSVVAADGDEPARRGSD